MSGNDIPRTGTNVNPKNTPKESNQPNPQSEEAKQITINFLEKPKMENKRTYCLKDDEVEQETCYSFSGENDYKCAETETTFLNPNNKDIKITTIKCPGYSFVKTIEKTDQGGYVMLSTEKSKKIDGETFRYQEEEYDKNGKPVKFVQVNNREHNGNKCHESIEFLGTSNKGKHIFTNGCEPFTPEK